MTERGVAEQVKEPASEQNLLAALLKPRQDEALKIWPVDKMVCNVRNNGPQLIFQF
jgi:putative SOS response-associated peptidase YedK